MLRNNLSSIMAAKKIIATKVAKDTGIARSTISKISNNSTEKIEYSTINTLCRYLGVTPSDFFHYVPIDFEFNFDLSQDFSFIDYSTYDGSGYEITFEFNFLIDCFINRNEYNFPLLGTCSITDDIFGNLYDLIININFENEDDKEEFRKIESQIPPAFHEGLRNDLEGYVKNAFYDEVRSKFDNTNYYDLLLSFDLYVESEALRFKKTLPF